MLQTEFIRSLQSNYERILLDKKPEERKYQYCILSRGGIKGLLPCSLRYINGLAYLYYDITSRQSVMQFYEKRCITRRWMKDFLWSLKQIQQELERFLLDDYNILWYPEQVFQDLEKNIFSFLYIPYYEGDNGFSKLIEFWVEHIDYEDEGLVECVYKMYEQFEQNGTVYLQKQIFEDAKTLEDEKTLDNTKTVENKKDMESINILENTKSLEGTNILKQSKCIAFQEQDATEQKSERKGIFHLLDNRKRKNKEVRDDYLQNMQQAMKGYAVAEETVYDEAEYGKTIYIEEKQEEREKIYRLYTMEGRVLAQLDKSSFSIGKKKGETDLVLEDFAVSRLHAKIIREKEDFYLEDMNSTNGTFKNGLRLQPYEKRKLEEEDEIRIGKTVLIFR